MEEKVRKELEKVRTMLKADGGDIDLIEVTDDGIVKVKLKGACAGCPFSQMTLQMGVERTLKKSIPEVKKVVAV
jgi:Fe-S cluster biogenesis protein NfuA